MTLNAIRVVAVAVVLLVGVGPVRGQILPATSDTTASPVISNAPDWADSAQASWNSARSAAMSVRAPGNMVNRARAQYTKFHASTMAVARRAPGNMVNRARAQYTKFHASTMAVARSGPTITETTRDLTLGEQVRVEMVKTLVSSFETTLTKLLALLVPGGGTNTGGNTNTDVGGLPSTGDPTDLLGTITGT
jgi:hypothetical protein